MMKNIFVAYRKISKKLSFFRFLVGILKLVILGMWSEIGTLKTYDDELTFRFDHTWSKIDEFIW